MPTAAQAMGALYGAWRLARLDAGGLGYFDASLRGFWHSFFAAVIVAPFFAVLQALRFGGLEVAPWRFVAVEAIAYVIVWFAFPLAMVSICRVLDRERRYFGYIVAYNWAAVLQNALYLPIAILGVTGALPAGIANFAGLAALVLILAYTWFITKTALSIGNGAAAGIVGFDLVLGLFINAIAESML